MQQPDFDRPLRRISNINLTLAPLRDEIGSLNQRIVVLLASRERLRSKDGAEASVFREFAEAEQRLAELWQSLEQATERLPPAYREDSRLQDTRESLRRLSDRLGNLNG